MTDKVPTMIYVVAFSYCGFPIVIQTESSNAAHRMMRFSNAIMAMVQKKDPAEVDCPECLAFRYTECVGQRCNMTETSGSFLACEGRRLLAAEFTISAIRQRLLDAIA